MPPVHGRRLTQQEGPYEPNIGTGFKNFAFRRERAPSHRRDRLVPWRSSFHGAALAAVPAPSGIRLELPDHRYRLGSATFRLGYQALEALDLRNVARPFMEELNEHTGETVHLGTLEGDAITYIDKVEPRHSVRMHSRVVAVANLHCTAVAKTILGFLPTAERKRLLRGHVYEARTTIP